MKMSKAEVCFLVGQRKLFASPNGKRAIDISLRLLREIPDGEFARVGAEIAREEEEARERAGENKAGDGV